MEGQGGVRAGEPRFVDRSPGRDPWVLVICLARVFLFANFMVVAAAVPVLMPAWGIGGAQAGSIITGFTLAYAFSLFATSWLADHFGAKRVALFSGWATAIAALGFAFFARDYFSALALYALSGLMQGGTYTPVVMLFAERYAPRRRGNAVGWLIGSTSVGYAGSLAVSGVGLNIGGWQMAFVITGILPLAGAALLTAVLWRQANTIHPRERSLSLRGVVMSNDNARRLIAGYTAHSWELLGLWAWVPAFIAANLSAGGWAIAGAAGFAAYVGASGHIAGAAASLISGAASDTYGRRTVLLLVAAACAVLSFSIGWLVAAPALIVVPLVLAYAFLAIGDSAVLSTALTETVEPAWLGSVLAVRSLAGFGAGSMAPIAFGAILDAVTGGGALAWGLAFSSLGIGGAMAAWFAFRLDLAGDGASRQR